MGLLRHRCSVRFPGDVAVFECALPVANGTHCISMMHGDSTAYTPPGRNHVLRGHEAASSPAAWAFSLPNFTDYHVFVVLLLSLIFFRSASWIVVAASDFTRFMALQNAWVLPARGRSRDLGVPAPAAEKRGLLLVARAGSVALRPRSTYVAAVCS